ncbi:hypothetical protein NIES4075_25910 [Tolypothrix sp. NIES-4075]|nr:hypothetical protein NIES4075_25910 [Tolypothrix sp. NIES-4075]
MKAFTECPQAFITAFTVPQTAEPTKGTIFATFNKVFSLALEINLIPKALQTDDSNLKTLCNISKIKKSIYSHLCLNSLYVCYKFSRPKSFLEDLPGLHLSENTLSAEILPGSAF